MKLLAALSAEQAGLRAVHGAGVMPLLLPLLRAGSAAGEGAYLSEGGTLLKRALADAEARPAGVRVVEAVVGMLPAAEGAGFDPFDAAEARLALRALEPIVPFQPSDAVSAMPSLAAVREAGGIARTLAALRGDEWALTRSLVSPAVSRFSGLLNEPDGMAVAHGLGALRTLVDVLITKEGSRWPNRNGDMVEVFPPPELIEALEPPECRAAFARRAITHTNEYYAAFSHNLMQTVDKLIKEHRQQHGEPPEGQDTPDRLVLTQRRQLLLARSQSANRSKGASATAAVAVVESAATSPVSLVDAERLEEAIDEVGDDPKLDPRVVAAAKRKLERARAQSKCTLTEKLAAARAGKACEFQFMRAKVLLARDYKSAPMHKSVEDDPELYTMLYLSSAECCQHMFRDKVLAVSHRWDRPNEPDPTGAQMKASKRMLRANPQYEYVWLVRRRALSCACSCGCPLPMAHSPADCACMS